MIGIKKQHFRRSFNFPRQIVSRMLKRIKVSCFSYAFNILPESEAAFVAKDDRRRVGLQHCFTMLKIS